MNSEFDITIERTRWEDHKAALEKIRRCVFIQEQQVPEHEEWDEWDAPSEHFIALSTKRDVVGVGRLQPDAKITRMAVLREWRGYRVGALLLTTMIERAKQCGMTPWLHAQTQALDFYRRHGFVVSGDEFEEAGILHCEMHWTGDV